VQRLNAGFAGRWRIGHRAKVSVRPSGLDRDPHRRSPPEPTPAAAARRKGRRRPEVAEAPVERRELRVVGAGSLVETTLDGGRTITSTSHPQPHERAERIR
jgi:hypothetical protein